MNAVGTAVVGGAVDYGAFYYFNRVVSISPVPWFTRDFAWQGGIGLALWLVLQVFWQTRARGHVRQGHLVRIVVLAWVGLVVWRRAILMTSVGIAVAYQEVTGRMFYRDWGWCADWFERLAEWVALGTLVWSLCPETCGLEGGGGCRDNRTGSFLRFAAPSSGRAASKTAFPLSQEGYWENEKSAALSN